MIAIQIHISRVKLSGRTAVTSASLKGWVKEKLAQAA